LSYRNIFFRRSGLKALDESLDLGKKVISQEFGSTYQWNTANQSQLLIVSTWRSGSTFLANILSLHPTVFHHYEPLMVHGWNQISQGKLAAKAVELLRSLFLCT